jgi:hypothetical protein
MFLNEVEAKQMLKKAESRHRDSPGYFRRGSRQAEQKGGFPGSLEDCLRM